MTAQSGIAICAGCMSWPSLAQALPKLRINDRRTRAAEAV